MSVQYELKYIFKKKIKSKSFVLTEKSNFYVVHRK
jgi:hypothetical protein